jgi:hypothetical protein
MLVSGMFDRGVERDAGGELRAYVVGRWRLTLPLRLALLLWNYRSQGLVREPPFSGRNRQLFDAGLVRTCVVGREGWWVRGMTLKPPT